MSPLQNLMGPDLATLLKRRENSLREATAKGTLSRSLSMRRPMQSMADREDTDQGEAKNNVTEVRDSKA